MATISDGVSRKITSDFDTNRKFETKIRDISTDVATGTYEVLVPETSQFENLKLMGDKINDIFDHTDEKVKQVMQNLAQTYNRKRSNLIDPWRDPDIHTVLQNNISFPEGYVAPVHSMAEALQDQNMVEEMMQKMIKARAMEIGKDANLMSKTELASSCLNAEKLTEINNAYYVLKNLPSSKGLKLKLEIQKRSQKI